MRKILSYPNQKKKLWKQATLKINSDGWCDSVGVLYNIELNLKNS